MEEFPNNIFSDEDLAASPIRNYFKGRTILLTGGTGFLGQLLLEKLLCCDVEHIYLLARAKKDKSATERLREMFAEVLFARMRKVRPNYMQHVSVIEGDMSALGLAIASSDRENLENTVQIIIHSAANVRFNERLYDLIMANLRGTRELLRLAEKCKKLEVFNYVSTAYSHCSKLVNYIKEDFYDAPIDPDTIIEFAERCNNQSNELEYLDILTERLIGTWPNTYSFSKSLSEAIVQQFAGKFPICVVRPSIVISTYQEPLAGWCNNIFGLNGMLFAVGIGIIRIVHARTDIDINIICADFAINGILATTWATYEEAKITKQSDNNKNHPKVYAIVSSKEYNYQYISSIMSSNIQQYPTTRNVWAVCDNTTTSLVVFKYLSIYYHFIAALLLDLVLKVTRSKMRLMPPTRKIQIFLGALSYFMINQWKFANENMRALCNRLHPIDKKLFFCDTRQFDFEKWSFFYMQGLKTYIAKESLDKVDKARIKQKRLNFIHFFVQAAFYLSQVVLIYLLAQGLGLVGYLSDTINSTIEFIKDPNEIRLI